MEESVDYRDAAPLPVAMKKSHHHAHERSDIEGSLGCGLSARAPDGGRSSRGRRQPRFGFLSGWLLLVYLTALLRRREPRLSRKRILVRGSAIAWSERAPGHQHQDDTEGKQSRGAHSRGPDHPVPSQPPDPPMGGGFAGRGGSSEPSERDCFSGPFAFRSTAAFGRICGERVSFFTAGLEADPRAHPISWRKMNTRGRNATEWRREPTPRRHQALRHLDLPI